MVNIHNVPIGGACGLGVEEQVCERGILTWLTVKYQPALLTSQMSLDPEATEAKVSSQIVIGWVECLLATPSANVGNT